VTNVIAIPSLFPYWPECRILALLDQNLCYVCRSATWQLKELFTFKKTFADNLLTPMSSKISMSFFLQKKLRFLMKTFQDFSPYNRLKWEPNGSRSKRQFQCSFNGL